jgi:hypothetical protein
VEGRQNKFGEILFLFFGAAHQLKGKGPSQGQKCLQGCITEKELFFFPSLLFSFFPPFPFVRQKRRAIAKEKKGKERTAEGLFGVAFCFFFVLF